MPDDYSSDTGTTGAVTAGGTATGDIETRRDVDWFAVDLVAGQTYVIGLEGASSSGGTLENTVLRGLYDKDGRRLPDTKRLDGGAGDDARLTFTPSESGTYYIAARGDGHDTGTYTVRVEKFDADSEASGARDLGDITGQTRTSSVKDSLDGGDDSTDYYRFTLSEAQTVRLNLRRQDVADLYLEDADGNVLHSSTQNGDPNGRIETKLQADTYYVRVVAREEGEAVYNLRYRATPLDTDATAAGATDLGDLAALDQAQVRKDSLDGGDDRTDYYRFTLSEAQTVRFNLRRQDAADLYLEDADGNVLHSSAQDGARKGGIEARLQADTYYVRVAAQNTEENSYTLRYRVVVPENVQESVPENVQESVPEPAGTDFPAHTSTQGLVLGDDAVTGTLRDANDRDWYAVALEAGRTYRIDLKGESTQDGTLYDPYVPAIYDADGHYLARGNDDGGVGLNSRAFFTPDADGTYYVEAAASPLYAVGGGTYTLSVAELADDYAAGTRTSGSFSVGSPATGVIEHPDDRDWFKVDLKGGKIYRIDLVGDQSGYVGWGDLGKGTLADPHVHGIYDAEGARLHSGDADGGAGNNARAYFRPTADATYYVEAGSGSGDRDRYKTGAYTVSVEEITDDFAADTDTTASVSVGGSARGEAETPGERDWFAVTLEAGKTYQIEVRGGDYRGTTLWDSFIRGGIHDGEGQLIDGTEFSLPENSNRITFLAPESGTYYVAAGSRDHPFGTGTYSVHVAEFDSDSVHAGAKDLGDITKQSQNGMVRDKVNDTDDWEDYFSFTLSKPKVVVLSLRKQDADADLYLEDRHGLHGKSTKDGTGNEGIREPLLPGTYYVKVVAQEAGENSYTLRYRAENPEPGTWFVGYEEYVPDAL